MSNVPFVTQIEPNGQGFNNCGPSCLTSLGAFYGFVPADRESMHRIADYIRDGYYDGDWWLGTYTDYPMMDNYVRREWRVPTIVVTNWQVMIARIKSGHPCIILVDNSVLTPRYYPNTPAFKAHHFITLNTVDDARAVFESNDPLNVTTYAEGEYTIGSVHYGAGLIGGTYALFIDAPLPFVQEDPAMIEALQARIQELEAQLGDKDGVNTTLQEQLDYCQTLKQEVEAALTQQIADLNAALVAEQADDIAVTPKQLENLSRAAKGLTTLLNKLGANA